MKTVSHPQDRFFRKLLQTKDVARYFLKYYQIVGTIDDLDRLNNLHRSAVIVTNLDRFYSLLK